MCDEKLTVCMIDDDDEDAFLARRIFSRHAPTVRFVHRADAGAICDDVEALTIPDTQGGHYPDFVFLDLNMPKVSGHAILRKLKGHSIAKKIPVFVFTTSDEQEFVDSAYSNGAAAYIVKPHTIDEYDRLVEAFVSFWQDRVKRPSNTSTT